MPHALVVTPVGGNTDRSELHAQAHKRLAIRLQELAVMDAKMDLKVLFFLLKIIAPTLRL